MTVIVIGTVKVESELIKQIADSLGTGSGEVIRVLKYLCPDEKPLLDIKVNFSGNIILDTPREPVVFPAGLKIIFNYGYSYHPNHGESCDYLWVNPSDIHDQLCALSGHIRTFFHRKCFMQLKRFVNLRFV